MKGIELCVECLAGRVELGQHRATHKYRLVDNGGLHLLGRWQTYFYLVIMFLVLFFIFQQLDLQGTGAAA